MLASSAPAALARARQTVSKESSDPRIQPPPWRYATTGSGAGDARGSVQPRRDVASGPGQHDLAHVGDRLPRAPQARRLRVVGGARLGDRHLVRGWRRHGVHRIQDRLHVGLEHGAGRYPVTARRGRPSASRRRDAAGRREPVAATVRTTAGRDRVLRWVATFDFRAGGVLMGNDTGDGTTRREVLDRGALVTVGAFAGAAAAAAPAHAVTAGGPVSSPSVSLEQALRVIRAAEQRAQRIGVPMFIVVVDSCGIVKASHRMDGNGQAGPTLAPLKAQTANGFRTATHQLAAAVAGDPARLASIASAPGFTLLGGGVPLRVGSAVIGAIGVGGGSAAQDVDVAEAGAAAL